VLLVLLVYRVCKVFKVQRVVLQDSRVDKVRQAHKELRDRKVQLVCRDQLVLKGGQDLRASKADKALKVHQAHPVRKDLKVPRVLVVHLAPKVQLAHQGLQDFKDLVEGLDRRLHK
jgi:hypothetical protein